MTARLLAKLKSTQGFMLAEQLVSIIFFGLLCIIVAAGLGVVMSAYADITQQTQAQALLSRTVEEVNDELAFARDVEGITFVSESVHARVEFVDTPEGISLRGNGIQTGTTGKTETVLLIPAAGSLVPSLTNLTYSNNTWKFTVTINQNSNAVATSQMTVARIGN